MQEPERFQTKSAAVVDPQPELQPELQPEPEPEREPEREPEPPPVQMIEPDPTQLETIYSSSEDENPEIIFASALIGAASEGNAAEVARLLEVADINTALQRSEQIEESWHGATALIAAAVRKLFRDFSPQFHARVARSVTL